ncbi:MAG: hypothetical protein U0835_20315 [Isosphaeraceae bacterium]
MTRSARLTALGFGLLLIPALGQTQAQPPGRRPAGDTPRAKAARPGARGRTPTAR